MLLKLFIKHKLDEQEGGNMKKAIGIIIIFTLVLGAYSPSFGAEEASEETSKAGRFQIVTTEGQIAYLVDTTTGQVWALSTTRKKGSVSLRWVPIAFTKGTLLPKEDGLWIEK